MTVDADTALMLVASHVPTERAQGLAWVDAHREETASELIRRLRDGTAGRRDVWIELLAALDHPAGNQLIAELADTGIGADRDRARQLRSP